MKIHFRDVQTGMVEARAVIEIEEGVYLNEVTLLNIDGQLVIEFPRKNFKGKNDRTHHLDIITFENEDKRVLWELQIKEAYRNWRKDNKKVLVYEDKAEFPEEEAPPKSTQRKFFSRSSERPGQDRQSRYQSDKPFKKDSYSGKSHKKYPSRQDTPPKRKYTK